LPVPRIGRGASRLPLKLSKKSRIYLKEKGFIR
jgi:hypothetical protein